MKVLMIVNPKSGSASARNKLIDALDVFSKYNYKVEVYVTQKQMDAYKKAKEVGYRYDIVIACGGDGTLNEVVNGLMQHKKKPQVGYFPSGTMNDFASNFNLTNDWKANALKICDGKENYFDVGLMNNSRYFNYVAAFGAFCDVPYITPQDYKKAIGSLAYVLEGVKEITEIKPVDVKVTCGDKSEDIKAVFGLVFSGNRVSGIKLLSKERGMMDDGEFNVLIVEYPDSIFALNDYLKVLARKNSKYFHWYKSSEISLEFKNTKTKWTIDGEKAESKKLVTIKNINKAMTIKV